MVNHSSQVKKRRRLDKVTAVEAAIAAVTGGSDMLELPISEFDPAPTSLDLPQPKQRQKCSRCGRRAVDTCPTCNSPLCEDCITGDEGSE
jgi:hypothetical protein